MLTAMFAALAVLTPPGFEAPASRSVARLGTHAGGEVSANATKTALRAPPNLWGTELATHGLQAQAGSATMGAAPAHNELQRCAAAAGTGRCLWPQPNAPGAQPVEGATTPNTTYARGTDDQATTDPAFDAVCATATSTLDATLAASALTAVAAVADCPRCFEVLDRSAGASSPAAGELPDHDSRQRLERPSGSLCRSGALSARRCPPLHLLRMGCLHDRGGGEH